MGPIRRQLLDMILRDDRTTCRPRSWTVAARGGARVFA